MTVTNIEFAGRSFKFEDLEDADLVAGKFSDGSFEPPLPIVAMALYSRTGGTFLDVGANSGIYSILARIARNDAKIKAFEPYPAAYDACLRNINFNGLGEKIDLYSIALSNLGGSATLHIPDQSHGLLESSASLEKAFKASKSTIEVKRSRLDDLEIADPISVIKVDIEGHEAAFLEGALNVIKSNRPFILTEILPGANFARLQRFLIECGYLDFRLRPDMAILDDTARFDPLAWNHVFAPPERISVFEEACGFHHIELVRRMRLG